MSDLAPVYPGTDPTICCRHCDDMGPNGLCSHCGKLHLPVTVFDSCRRCFGVLPKDPIMRAELCDECAAKEKVEVVGQP